MSGMKLDRMVLRAALVLVATALPVFSASAEYDWGLPEWLDPPPVPTDNPVTQAKVDLGHRLFFELDLSGPRYMSCATCHEPAMAFTDGRDVAVGVTGEFHSRNSMSLLNVAYHGVLTWADPELETLEDQVRVPLFGINPIEMNVAGNEESVLNNLIHDPVYPGMFDAAFPQAEGRIDYDLVSKAIATYVRTMVSATSPYDFYHFGGDETAMSDAALRGEELFNSERLNCGTCHSGMHFTDAIPEPAFHNNGLYNLDGEGGLPEGNQGLFEHSGKIADIGRFRTPGLRNIALTAPYMHDGSLATLDAVIDHYASGGEAARLGEASPLRSEHITGFVLKQQERADLLAFLESLTDRRFLADLRFQTPLQ
ncbi:MAG: di-heme enzyme [Alphaproteobacteria bacterium]|nr:di-heme enzyme [Alphaproteobacteria bacterium]